MQEVRDSAENIAGILDDVWRYTPVSFSQDRMAHMFDVIGYILCCMIQNAASKVNLWKPYDGLKDNQILALLSESLDIVKVWMDACKSLTETYWPNYALHPWKGKTFVPLFCVSFEKRLKQVHDIRTTYNQLSKLLTKSEQAELKTDQLLEPFQTNLRPSETKIAEKLKPRLHNTSTKQMLYEFNRYKVLINRPLIKHSLSNELETFVRSLMSMLRGVQGDMQTDEVDVMMYRPPEMSQLVYTVQWAKQMEAKAQAKAGTLQLSTDKPVVEFSSKTQLMEINFNPRLVRTELEARTLCSLGLPAPSPAVSTQLDTLTNALNGGHITVQVASFHNTLADRMIPSTRPMMLQAALDLSALVQNQKPVYWGDEEQIATYTESLKNMVLKLEGQNSYLTSQHFLIRGIVEKLMDTELLAKQNEWKKAINDIRDIIEKVETNGYKNTDMWRCHWEVQLYKAMETQHSWLGNKAVRQIEETLSSLEALCETWTLRGAIACVGEREIDALCADSLTEPEHWEQNFKACKAYGQTVAKMTFCRSDAAELDTFIANVTLVLEDKALPKNAKELAEVTMKQRALQEKMPQAELVKSSMTGDWDNLTSSIEAWYSRWSQARARLESSRGVEYNEMLDRCRSVFDALQHYLKLVAERDELLKLSPLE
ncbi:unnamed protein product [Leptidea sinapis]|uniref:Dynein heavy chain tail domain-containing protein n=1 Tax=Leptidea sinapis TaxID=189913 RepID=A0A5E4QAZ1_9NEOP|nr:unnamed protein product [Leptidea sinapis]